MSISTALKARQEALRDDREAGFTLIELLVVVIIIGILAAIAIPVYLGVQGNAKDSAVKSDLTNAKTAIVTVGTDNNGALPTAITKDGSATVAGTAGIDLKPNGWSVSSNTSDLKYVPGTLTGTPASPTTWCILGTGQTGNKFTINSTGAVATADKAATTCTAA